MRISLRPDELRITPKALEGQDDAPVFVCRPHDAREYVALTARMASDDERTMGDWFLDLFAERVVRVEGLEVDGGTPYDHEAHRDRLPNAWQIEVGRRIWEAAALSETDQGKSSSPSD